MTLSAIPSFPYCVPTDRARQKPKSACGEGQPNEPQPIARQLNGEDEDVMGVTSILGVKPEADDQLGFLVCRDQWMQAGLASQHL
jgi:hypothetical protein